MAESSNSDGETPTPVFIMATYTIHSQDKVEVAVFDESNTAVAILGSEVPTKPPPGSVVYSGMHDQGPLPKPKEGGLYAQLIGCAQAGKVHSDEYLTGIIQQEKKTKDAPATSGEQATKKPKVQS